MYRDEILDHFRNPRNTGELEEGLEQEGENPSCGDETTVHVKVEDGRVEEFRHETDGCAISTASASILSKEIQGMKVEEVLELDRDWMVETLDIEVSPMRVKCAVLALKTVQKALEEER